ncbi:MAG: NAD(P)-dependent oxidoreductase [Betaproteobacteria bacterium]|nr:NAD(P)-dependent oxidoreductase [Betaproteobacteria bacterium]
MNIGFVGLGRMGRPIARRLIEAGHDVVVFNRTPGRIDELVDAGARAADDVAAVCRGRSVVLTMLADDAALTDVAIRPGGLRDSLSAGAIHVAMGTHGVAAMSRIDAAHREASQRFVAAPVLGRPEAAEAGQLGIVVAGAPDASEACAPLFEAIGRRTFDAGTRPAGASAIKLANNFVLGCAIEAIGEAFALVRKHDVPANVMQDVLTDGLFGCVAYRTYARIIADEAYDHVGFSATLALKDATLVLAAGEAARVPLPGANTLRDRLLGAIAHGDGERDWAVIAREQARASGLG